MRRRIGLGGLMLLVALVALALGVHRHLKMRMYVQGDVRSPGLMRASEGMTVLDALKAAGDTTLPASSLSVRLVRPSPLDASGEVTLPVDLAAIVGSGDQSTNYPIRPGDRLVVFRESGSPPGKFSKSPR